MILNVTASTAGDYGCGIELNSGTLVEGDTYSMHPLGTYVRNMCRAIEFRFINLHFPFHKLHNSVLFSFPL